MPYHIRETTWYFLSVRLKVTVQPRDSGHIAKKKLIHIFYIKPNACTQMLVAALLTIARLSVVLLCSRLLLKTGKGKN